MNYQKVNINKIATGKRIASAISSSKYSFDDVAKALGLSSNRIIYYWINGTKLPSLENIVNLAYMFNIKLEDLIVTD